MAFAKQRIIGRILEIDRRTLVVDRQQWAEGIGAARGVDVHRCRRDMQVLGVQHDQQEDEHDTDLQPDANGLDDDQGLLAQSREPGADPVGEEGPTFKREVAKCRLRASVEEQGPDHVEDHE